MDFSGCVSDESIGPTVQGCRDDFDFTLKFEKIFLSIIPAALFIALSLPRSVYLAQRPKIVGGNALKLTKLVFIIGLVALNLAVLVLSSAKLRKYEALFIGAAAVNFASCLAIAALSPLEHTRSPRPSILLNAYLFLSVLCDVTQTRTLWLASKNADETTYSRLFTTSVVFKAALILLESQHKTKWMSWDIKDHSPEETSGLFGLSAFVWLNRLFLTGFRTILTLDDLFALDQNMAAEALYERLVHQIEKRRLRNKMGQKYWLAKALLKTLAVPVLLPVAPRVAVTAFQFCQPFLISTTLDYLQKPASESSKNTGYGLIGATLLIYAGSATSSAVYWYFQERALVMARGALAAAVYKKTTETKLSDADDSAALTLMSADIESIRNGLLQMHEFWANTIEVALASWLLQRQLGAAFAAPIVVVLCCALCSFILTKFTGKRQRAWMEMIQKRVGLTSNVIAQMKHLRISGLTTPVEGLVHKMRLEELRVGSRFRMIMVTGAMLSFTPLTISPVVTFAFTARTLDVNTIFTSYSFLLLLASPLTILFQAVTQLQVAFTCLGRIQAFLEKDPRVDFRASSLNQIREKEPAARRPSQEEKSSTAAIAISEGSFGWTKDKLNLQDINLNIPASRLTMVVGPVASGKSTLCKTILGEMPVSQGHVTMGNHTRRIGYCDQTPYLSNSTVQENIIGFAPLDQERYREVIDATALQPDLALLPQGDQSKVGSNGITLSGGQKQRVSMARALYLDTDFFVFDDILSGLDADTEEKVFSRVFSPTGLLRRRNATVVLCTHSVRHLPVADHIAALGVHGRIVEQGTFDELMSNQKYVHSLGIKSSEDTESDDRITPVEGDRPSRQELLRTITTKSTAESVVEQERARMMGDTTVYRYYFRTLKLWTVAVFLLFGLGFGFFANFSYIWLRYWSEDISAPVPTRSNAFYIGLYALFQISCLISIFIACTICFTKIIESSGANFHKNALRTVVSAPLKFFTTTDTGVVTNLFSQDMTLLDRQLPNSMLNVVLDASNAIGQAAVIATSSPWLAISYPFLLGVLYGIQKFYLRTSRQLRLLDLEAKSPLYTNFIDTIKGVATFRAFGWVQIGISVNNQLIDTSQRPAYLLAMIQRWLAFTMQIVVTFIAVIVVTLATQLRANSAFTGASLIALMSFGETISYIITSWTQLETSIGAVSRLKSFSDKVTPEDLPGEDVEPPAEWPEKGEIRIEGVSASYEDVDSPSRASSSGSGSNTTGSQNLALENISLTIAPGEKVALCGRSGSGKSSTLLLLLRLLDPTPTTSTHMTIDALPLHTIRRATLRQRLIAVPQDPVFLPDGTSIRANLDPSGAAPAAACAAVVAAVGLGGLVEERGGLEGGLVAESLSAGQRQLFSLARAMLRRRVRDGLAGEGEGGEKGGRKGGGGVLLLDEVSSSVDRDTDRAMQAVIRREFEGYTVVMVSHRLDVVMDFDTVVVLDRGKVVESGRPRELVETEGSRFRELWMVGNKG